MTVGREGKTEQSQEHAQPLIHTFSVHCRRRYGCQVGKIAIDMGVACPNREKGGCIFCRPASFTPQYLLEKGEIGQQIERGRERLSRNGIQCYFAYFQQETCTAVDQDTLLAAIDSLLTEPACLGLILSTRPDYIDRNLLQRLADRIETSGKDCLFELGLQTVHDRSLKLLNRNHTFEDFCIAFDRIKGLEVFDVGAHLIFGIPGESKEEMLASLKTVCDLGVDSLKLHHLQVIRGTALHTMYERGEVEPFSLSGYSEFLMDALQIIPSRVVIHRLWASSHRDLLVAPRWDILATHLSRRLQQRMLELGIYQGMKA